MEQEMGMTLCSEEDMARVIQAAELDDADGVARADELLNEFPGDPRLHFLRGSLLASLKRYDEARQAMTRSIEIAPDYDIARFQLGLLELSSGDAAAADATLTGFDQRPQDYSLRLLAEGLRLLARDEFAAAIERLRAGIARNTEHPVVNRDMQMLIDETMRKAGDEGEGEATSQAHLLLQQYEAKSKH